jgi:hypothetical protein
MLPELRTYSMAAMLGACCPSNAGSVPELSSPWTNLLFFFGEADGPIDASVSPDGDWEPTLGAGPVIATFSSPLLEPEVVPVPFWLPIAFVPGIYMPRDMSPTCFTMISMSSSVGITFSSFDLVAWSKKIGMQDGGWLMESSETKLEVNFHNIVSSTLRSRNIPWPCSSRVVSFSPVYNLAARPCYWRGAIRQERKSNKTIIDVRPFSARNWILLRMGS